MFLNRHIFSTNQHSGIKKIYLDEMYNSNIPAFIDYVINDAVIKLPIYFNSQMRIVYQFKDICPVRVHVFIQARSACKL